MFIPTIVRQNCIHSVCCGLAANLDCQEFQEGPKFPLVDCTEAEAQPQGYGGVGNIKFKRKESGKPKSTANCISGPIFQTSYFVYEEKK